MKLAKLKSLEMYGFRSFYDKTTIKFPENGILHIKGSSGVGKSNLTHGLAFSLDYCSKSATVLKSNIDPDVWYSSVELELNGSPLVSTRGSTPELFFEGTVHGTVAQKKDKLSQIFGINTNLIKYLTYRTQRTNGMFLSLSDEEKKTFLSEILGINSFDTASDTSSNTIKSLENQILVKENQINNLNGQIDMLRKVNNLDPKTILDIDSKIEENEHNMSTLVSQIDMLNIEKDLFLAKMRDVDEMYTHRASQVANISREIIKNSSENKKKQLEESIELINLQQKLDELDVQYKNIDFNSKTINDEIQKTSKSIENSNLMINKISYEIDSTKKDIKNIELTIIDLESDVNCGACGQPITDLQKQSINIKIENLKLNQNNLKNKLNTQLDDLNRLKKHQLEHLSPSKYQLEQELLDLTKKTDEWTISRNENRSLFEIIKQNIIKKFDDDIILAQEKYLAEQKEITVQKDKETKVLGVQLNGILEQYKVQESLLRTLQYENLSLDKEKARIQGVLATVNELEAKIQSVIHEKYQLENILKIEKDVLSIVHKDGFPAYYFEQILEEISMEINNLLGKVPNTSNINFSFGDKVAKTGKVRKTITPIVDLQGVKIPFNELSGGQSSVIELVSDLAVREVIARRVGIKFNWIVLDEVFTGLGRAEKDALIELLTVTVAHDTLLLLIEHDSEYQDRFNQTITVYNESGKSKIG